jgi:HicB-like protein involved in pilus formation
MPIYRGVEVFFCGRAGNRDVGLFLRLDPELHSRVKRAAARREETVSAFVRRALSNELQRLGAGRVVADAIRKRSSGLGLDHSIKE